MISSSSMDLPNSNSIPNSFNSLTANPQGHSVLLSSFIPGESEGQLHLSNIECHKSSSVYSSKGSSDMEGSKGLFMRGMPNVKRVDVFLARMGLQVIDRQGNAVLMSDYMEDFPEEPMVDPKAQNKKSVMKGKRGL